LPALELARIAVDVFGEDRVQVSQRLDDAIDIAVGNAEADARMGGAGVIITGSIVTVGEARRLLGPVR
jgi:dihydrofolate synthase / folylpolyglutamate synthase